MDGMNNRWNDVIGITLAGLLVTAGLVGCEQKPSGDAKKEAPAVETNSDSATGEAMQDMSSAAGEAMEDTSSAVGETMEGMSSAGEAMEDTSSAVGETMEGMSSAIGEAK